MNKEYYGSLNTRKCLHPVIFKAIRVYKNQFARCNNKNIRGFIDYGKKRIRVEYSLRQFVHWYVNKFPTTFDCYIKDISVGRINHDKNYSIDNIEFQTRSENTKEMIGRCVGNFSNKVDVYKNGQFVKTFRSIKSASEYTGYYFSYVHRCINGMKQTREYQFKLNEVH